MLHLTLWPIHKHHFSSHTEKRLKHFTYIDGLEHALDTFSIDINLGNCNVNYLHGYNIIPLDGLMTSYDYVQVVQSATFMSDVSLLGHVYITQMSWDATDSTVVNVYYSDHDVVKITIYSTTR